MGVFEIVTRVLYWLNHFPGLGSYLHCPSMSLDASPWCPLGVVEPLEVRTSGMKLGHLGCAFRVSLGLQPFLSSSLISWGRLLTPPHRKQDMWPHTESSKAESQSNCFFLWVICSVVTVKGIWQTCSSSWLCMALDWITDQNKMLGKDKYLSVGGGGWEGGYPWTYKACLKFSQIEFLEWTLGLLERLF